MIEPPRCPDCNSPVAADQRYCVACGARLGALGFPLPAILEHDAAPVDAAAVGFGLPSPRASAALVLGVFGVAVLMGGAVGPLATGASATRRQLVVDMGSGAAGGSAASATAAPGTQTPSLSAPSGNVAAAPKAPSAPSGSSGAAAAASGSPAPAAAPATPPAATTPPAAAVPGPTAPAPKPTVAGVVVHTSTHSQSYSVVTSQGELIPIHAQQLPAGGQLVKTAVRQLANGTFAGDKEKVTGQATSASFQGAITYVNPTTRVYTLSVRGASVLVHITDPNAPLPPLGSMAKVTVTIKPPPSPPPPPPPPGAPSQPATIELDQTAIQVGGPVTGSTDIEGIVASVDTVNHKLMLSADDVRDSAADLSIDYPASIDVTKLTAGKVLDATVKIDPVAGTYTLTGLSDDTDAKSADDRSLEQGDQAPPPSSSSSTKPKRSAKAAHSAGRKARVRAAERCATRMKAEGRKLVRTGPAGRACRRLAPHLAKPPRKSRSRPG